MRCRRERQRDEMAFMVAVGRSCGTVIVRSRVDDLEEI